ncbi:MAG: hypothetical protein CR982_08225 [Candidatus Cloacimonadota bacterium]|nr:MAG: hypothetical protein CR982_08225 [Candidatus Cloacimonadota bacterium]PIE77662.1 MAG: hypothetical protein CSA15_12125 [Candidatus Delongbacteria bacterium]
MKKFLIILFILLNINSCKSDKYNLIEKYNLSGAFIMNSSKTFKGYFYMGTDSEYHYFQSRWVFEKDKYFKIRKNDLIVNEPFEYKTKELRISIFEINTIFGKGSHILYVK